MQPAPLKKFSHQERDQNIQTMQDSTFDICVIGGGITGAGVARDAASRGMRVCLIEQNDFASGTSSRSSKLIHGGIRYLENLEFGLVFEALNERHILFEIAPHLVHPLTFVLPVYKGGRVGMFKMGLGMWLYDALALMHAPKLHERLSEDSTMSRLPSLRSGDLLGSYVYSDAYMDDDRLVIETLRSANRYGAVCANYLKAGRGTFDENGRMTSLEVHHHSAVSETVGAARAGQSGPSTATTPASSEKSFTVKAKHFISTVGPWTDQFASTLFEWKKILRPSKGIHLTLSRARLPIEDAVVMATGNDKRIIFAIPRNDMVIVGTTDTDFQQLPETVHSERADVEYLLEIVGHYFPEAKITEADIISSYSGVRPLVADGSESESKTSREHVIINSPHNVTFVAGGKYTTYRRMARDILESVLKHEFVLEDRIRYARNQTREVINPLITAEKLSEAITRSVRWSAEYGLQEKQTRLLAERHGFEALEILEEGEKNELQDPWEMEALFACRYTMCLHLRDFMLRRSPLFLSLPDHGFALLDRIAGVFQKERGWSSAQVEEEKKMYLDHLKFEMGWRG